MKRGQCKGHLGKTVEVSDSTVYAELISKMNKITVKRACVRMLGYTPSTNPTFNSGVGDSRGTMSFRPRSGTQELR